MELLLLRIGQGIYLAWLYTWYIKNYITNKSKRALNKNPQKKRTCVLSVGNLLVGGTGKTPLVDYLLNKAEAEGLVCAVFSRGYGRKAKTDFILNRNNANVTELNWQEMGDEPCWLAERHLKTDFYVGNARAELLRLYGSHYDLCILDDGFQQLQIEKSWNLAVFDATQALSNLHLLPYGRLRESLRQLKRADAVVINRAQIDQAKTEALRKHLEAYIAKDKIFTIDYAACGWLDTKNNFWPLGKAQGVSLAVFCSIGHPEQFRAMISQCNLAIKYFKAFPDHYAYNKEDLTSIIDAKVDWVVTTEKDWVKIAYLWPKERPLFRLKAEMRPSSLFEEYLHSFLIKGEGVKPGPEGAYSTN